MKDESIVDKCSDMLYQTIYQGVHSNKKPNQINFKESIAKSEKHLFIKFRNKEISYD
jgi:hypothetical protein